MASYTSCQKSLLIKQHAKLMSLVDKIAVINRKSKLFKQQHTLKCRRNETVILIFVLNDRTFRQARIFNVTWRLTISSQKFQIFKNVLKYSFIFVELCINTEWKPKYLFLSRTFISNFNLLSPLKLGRIGWTSTGNNQGCFPSWRCIWKKENHFNYWSSFYQSSKCFVGVFLCLISSHNRYKLYCNQNIKHSFCQQQGKKRRSFSQILSVLVSRERGKIT